MGAAGVLGGFFLLGLEGALARGTLAARKGWRGPPTLRGRGVRRPVEAPGRRPL